MAGSSSPSLPVPGTSGRLETSRFGKQRGSWFHSLPAVRPRPWGRLELRSPSTDDAATAPTEERRLVSKSDSQEVTSRQLRPLLHIASERNLTRAPISLPVCLAAGKGAKVACGPSSGAPSAEPLQRAQEPADRDRFCDPTNYMRPKAWSTEVKTVNLEASLRLVPQVVSTPVVVAVAKERSGLSSHRGAFRTAKKGLVGSHRGKKGALESPRSKDIRWIERGAVVSPTHAVVLRNPLKVWRKTSVGDKDEEGGGFTEASEESQRSFTTSSLGDGANGKAAKRGTTAPICIETVPLFLVLAVLCLLGLWGLHVLTANRNRGVAYSVFGGKAGRPGGGVGDSLTVPPEDDLKPIPRRIHGRRAAQGQHDHTEEDGRISAAPGQDAGGVADRVSDFRNASAGTEAGVAP